MKPLRIAVEVVLILGVGVAALLAVLSGFLIGLVPHTVDNGRLVEESFRTSGRFIDRFTHSEGRLPAVEEFNNWKMLQPAQTLGVRQVALISPDRLPNAVTRRFGSAGAGDYALEMWRGEWSEYYASWVGKSTVDDAASLYAGAVSVFLGFLTGTGVLWGVARRVRAANTRDRVAG